MAVINEIITSGGGVYTVPTGVNFLTVIAVGGGGGGSSAVGGFGGGGGGLRRIVDMPVSGGEKLVYNVGQGGSGGVGGGYGQDGEDSWVKNFDQATFNANGVGAGNVTYVLAEGGKGGKANGIDGQGFGGTTTTTATITLSSQTVVNGNDAPTSIYSTTSGVNGATNSNPEISWTVSGLPAGVTVSSYRVHLENLSTAGKFVHWHLTNINPSVNSINFGSTGLPSGATVQPTGWSSQTSPFVNTVGYGGPAPSSGKNNYRLTISAILSGSSSVLTRGIEFYAGTGTIIPNQATATFPNQSQVVTGSGVASIGGQGGGGSLLGYFSNVGGKAIVRDGGQGGNGGAPDYSPPVDSPGCGGGGAAGFTNAPGAQGAYGKNSDGSFIGPTGGGGGGGNAGKYGATGGGGVGVSTGQAGSNGSTAVHSLLATSIAGASGGSGGQPSQGVTGSASSFSSNTLLASGGGEFGGGGAGMQSSKGTILGGGGSGVIVFRYEEPILTPTAFAFDQINNAAINTTYESTSTNQSVTTNYATISGLPPGQVVPITVTGTALNKAISISTINNGAYLTNFSNLTVSNGSQIRVRSNSSTSSASTVYTRVQIGNLQADFTIVTSAIGGNNPSPLPQFIDVNDALLSTTYFSNVVQISGLTAPATVVLTGSNSLRVAVSSSNAVSGTGALVGATFGTTATVTNGQYLQLRMDSASTPNSPVSGSIVIGSSTAIVWNITTGVGVDITPTPFTFQNITNAITSPQTFYTASRTFGDAEFTANYDVPVTLVNFSAGATVSVRATPAGGTPGSFGSFPVNVRNGYTLEVRMDAAPTISTTRFLTIRVGNYDVNPWNITTAAAPDSTPNQFNFVPVTNSPPSSILPLVSSNLITISGFSVPISINCSIPTGTGASGQPALISINGDTAVVGPRQINPNDSVRIDMAPSSQLGAVVTTTVTAGGVSANFSVTTYATAPDTSNIFGQWYSAPAVIQSGTRKKRKEDGLTIGTVITVTKDRTGNWGVLDGSDNSRFPGFLECDGKYLDPKDYIELFNVIGNTYGGDGALTPVTTNGVVTDYTSTGKFRLPNYRNRKLAGVGRVDGNAAGSPGLVTTKGSDPDGVATGDNVTPGSSGGQWYIDTVDASGTPPLEQVFDSTPNDTEGLFWRLGNISTTGYSNVIGETTYVITGSMNVVIGPLNEALTAMPGHAHNAPSAIPTSGDSSTTVGWGFEAGTGWAHGKTGNCNETGEIFIPDSGYQPSQGIADISQGFPNFAEYVEQGFQADRPGTPVFRYTWWQNVFEVGGQRVSKLNSVMLDNNAASQGGGPHLASLDVRPGTAGTVLYTAPGGQLTHAHYLRDGTVNGDYGPQANFYGYGNSSGGGAVVGITSPSTTVTLSFEQSSPNGGLGISTNDATFTLSNAKQLIPNVTLVPQKRVSLMNKYSRTKYLIKAF